MAIFSSIINYFARVDGIVADTYNAEFYPYRVEINPEVQSKLPTDTEISELHKLATPEKENTTLVERVKKITEQEGQFIVDKFFQVINTPDRIARAQEAYEKWSSLRVSSQRGMACGGAAGVATTALTLNAPHHTDSPSASFFSILLGGSVIVVSCMWVGGSLARFHYTDRQCILWKDPGIDFAQRRSAALKLSLPEILQKKCRFSASDQQDAMSSKKLLKPINTKGTLHPVEILSKWKEIFTKIGKSLFDRHPTTLEEQQQWVREFCGFSILTVEFFNEDREILETPAWTDAHNLFKAFNSLKRGIQEFEAGISERLVACQDIMKKVDEVAREIHQKISKISERYSTSQIKEYQALILEACKLEMEPTLDAVKQEQCRLSCPLAPFYPQVRVFLESVQKKLIENKSTGVDSISVLNPEPGNLPSAPFKFERNIIQLVLNRSKSMRSSDREFLGFIDAIAMV